MSQTEIINEEPVVNTKTQSKEDQFFGKTTEINSEVDDTLEVEIIDDTPEEDRRPKKSKESNEKVDNDTLDQEIADYSQRAADRINQVKYEYHEERRAKEAAARESKEAVSRLQTMISENERLQKIVEQGGQALNKTAHNNALWAKQNAQVSFKKAYEEGDADAMSQAQELLSKATLAEQQANSTAQRVQNHVVQNMPAQEIQQPAQRQLDPDMEQWATKNTWFMGGETFQQEMTSYAMYLDQKSKHNPASNPVDYYAEIDKEMKKEFPDFFGVSSDSNSEMVVEETPKRQRQTVVATATRDSGNKKPTQIRLTKTQVKLARQLGITPEKYANQLLKES
jgi:hypothetical protein|tara:strand:- start:1959 stop:2975 length:1017 start_codon:yes stop_codon:yes gene_type:complete